jgi:hypothetical protein
MSREVHPLSDYHSKVLTLMGITAREAADAATQMAAIEARIGRPLPPSLREWYSLEGACALLERYSNGDHAIAVADLGRDGLLHGDLLVFRHENQWVCHWAVRLDGSDDPPVVVDYDDSFKTFRPCAAAFSAYVYACMWDWGTVVNNEALMQAQNRPLSDEALTWLRRHFTPELETFGWPGHTQYRFRSPGQRILIWAAHDQADWWLAGDSEEALCRLVKRVWSVDAVGVSLWSNTQEGEAILRRARSEK